MKYAIACPNCDAPLLDSDRVCPYCRHKITNDFRKQLYSFEPCPSCHERAVIRENGCKICRSCGWAACS